MKAFILDRYRSKTGLRAGDRFHHLCHTTASLPLMQGADLAAVQRIMRHQDPRITTEVYGHLAPGYLKKEIDRLRFEPLPAHPNDTGGAVQAPAAAAASAAGSGPTKGPATTRRAAHRSRRARRHSHRAAPCGSVWYGPPRSPKHRRPVEEELDRILAELSCRGERI